jgi:hypothetical protein
MTIIQELGYHFSVPDSRRSAADGTIRAKREVMKMAEIGKIEKPSADSVAGKRKLYCVPSVYPVEQAPQEYNDLVRRYWDEVSEQIERLEHAGKIRKIFCENLFTSGQESLDVLGKINDLALQIVKKKIDEGADLFPIESEDIFGPFVDWRNCLAMVRTHEVATKILDFYGEVARKRIAHILEAIEKALAENEAGMLVMADEDRMRLQFPQDIEVFLVTPRSYDDLMRWLRDRSARQHQEGQSPHGE